MTDGLPGAHDTAEADAAELLASRFFDWRHYARQAGLVGEDGASAACHYLNEGWRAGLDPGPDFSTGGYLRANPDVAAAGVNPLLHYLRDGCAEGRRIVAPRAIAPLPTAPSDAEWSALVPRGGLVTPTPAVDVVVPVYRGHAETLRCLYSVLAAPQRTPFRLLVMDDCSPEPALSAALDGLARRGLIELRRSDRNLGFVATCNLAMAEHPDRDVVLLNSDTEVHNDWLDRLRATALGASDVGTVTPLSNNAEICSYPVFLQDNITRLELDDAELDQLAARANAGRTVEVPTGVGFCMYVRRACLNAIGLFDVERFGRGYGEENDLCCRAAAAGWRNLLACDVFVHHHGATSFGGEKAERVRAALRVLAEQHPNYLPAVARFIEADPVRPLRVALDAARLARRAGDGAMLIVTHDWGGGTEQHVHDLAGLLEAAGVAVFFCRAAKDAPGRIEITDPVCDFLPNLPKPGLADGPDSLAQLINSAGVRHIHIQHLAGLGDAAPDFFRWVARRAGISYDVTLHDYMAVCPRINLIDLTGVYCGEPSADVCESCLAHEGSPFGRPTIWTWREQYQRLLSEARRVFVPHEDVALRMRRFFPDIHFEVRPHPEPGRSRGQGAPTRPRQGRRRVALLGAIGPHKGSALLEQVARHACDAGLPLDFVVVGYTDRDAALRPIGNVEITGPYEATEAAAALIAAAPDLVWFPSVWPETYAYTLSTAFEAGVFPVVFDFGASGARVRAAGWGAAWPIGAMLSPEGLCRALLDQPIHPKPPDLAARTAPAAYPNPLRSYYGLPADSFDPRAPREEPA